MTRDRATVADERARILRSRGRFWRPSDLAEQVPAPDPRSAAQATEIFAPLS
ncbi:MAG TPA: hypothetical protein PKE32_05790 [Miltoncostaeaceae bacterium]|nr:hypothetical protein [Miltoncostaeaceae bacterium]